MKRKSPPKNDEVHHVVNKSIAGYRIFNSATSYERMIALISYFSFKSSNLPKFSDFISSASVKNKGFEKTLLEKVNQEDKLVQIIAYCVMPTHFHLAVKQLKNNGISAFVGNISNAYSRYFNNKNNRKGRLWQGKFKNKPVESDEQLLHLTRYIHLNPVTAGLIEDPKSWEYSSYHEYIQTNKSNSICEFEELIDIKPKKYEEFVNARKDYQRELAQIKNLIIK